MSGVLARIAGIAIPDSALAVHARLRGAQRTGETQIVVADIRDECLLVSLSHAPTPLMRSAIRAGMRSERF
jgi:hypothetical protein